MTLLERISSMKLIYNKNKCRRFSKLKFSYFSTLLHNSTAIISLTLIILIYSTELTAAYEKSKCEFQTINYSLEWAFEPLTQHVVFVLNTKLPSVSSDTSHIEQQELWSGVGFSGQENNAAIEFIGVKIKGHRSQIFQSNIKRDGTTDFVSPSVFMIGNEYDVNSNSIIAKFSRSINQFHMENGLNTCITFNALVDLVSFQMTQSPNFRQALKKISVCNIKKYCTINVHQINSEKIPKYKVNKSLIKKKKIQDNKSKDLVEVLHSVNVSGTGNPCSFSGPEYTVNWTYNKTSDCVDFVIKHPIIKGKWWSAVGIGDSMADMDIGVVFLEDGKAKKMIDYYSTSYGVPNKDEHEDWVLHDKSTIVEEKLEGSSDKQKMAVLYFSRKIETNDSDKDKSMEGCVLFQLAVNSGKYGSSFAIQKHVYWPNLYKACNLKKNCAIASSKNFHHYSIAQDNNDEEKKNSLHFDESNDHSTSVASTKKNVLNETIKNKFKENDIVKNEKVATNKKDNVVTILTEHKNNSKEAIIPESEADFEDGNLIGQNKTLELETKNNTFDLKKEDNIDEWENTLTTIQSLFGEFTTTDTPELGEESNVSLTTKKLIETDQKTITTTPEYIIPVLLGSQTINEITVKNLSNINNEINFNKTATTLSTILSTKTSLVSSINFTEPIKETTVLNLLSIAPTTETTLKRDKLLENTFKNDKITIDEESSGEEPEEITSIFTSTISAVIINNKKLKKCDSEKRDHQVCKNYMKNYLAKVEKWADQHNELMENQYGKACKLLAAVPNVPSLCCHIFQENCKRHII